MILFSHILVRVYRELLKNVFAKKLNYLNNMSRSSKSFRIFITLSLVLIYFVATLEKKLQKCILATFHVKQTLSVCIQQTSWVRLKNMI